MHIRSIALADSAPRTGSLGSTMSWRRCESNHCVRPRSGVNPQPRLATPGARLCRACKENLRRDLVSMPRLHVECEGALTYSAPRGTERVTGSGKTGIALNADAVEARAAIARVLAGWSSRVVRERRVSRPTERGIASLARFLVNHLDWLVTLPAAGVLAGELHELATAAQLAAQKDAAPRRVELGLCVHPGCESPMFSKTPDTDARVDTRVSCDSGHSWGPHQWLLLARRTGHLDLSAQRRGAS